MQIDPTELTLKPPGSKRLKLEDEKLLSNFAFNFNLRRHIKGGVTSGVPPPAAPAAGDASAVIASQLVDFRDISVGRCRLYPSNPN